MDEKPPSPHYSSFESLDGRCDERTETSLVVVAGVTQIDGNTVHLDTTETAEIGANCTVGDWSSAHYHLKGGRSTPQAIVLRNSIVTIGGWGDLDVIDIYADVQISAARDDGSPGPWHGPLLRG